MFPTQLTKQKLKLSRNSIRNGHITKIPKLAKKTRNNKSCRGQFTKNEVPKSETNHSTIILAKSHPKWTKKITKNVHPQLKILPLKSIQKFKFKKYYTTAINMNFT